MANTKIRIKRKDDTTELKILIAHPMEHGRNRDPETNELIPAHYIKTLTVRHNDKTIITARMAGSISKNPYFAFVLNGIEMGDLIRVDWTDNRGLTGSAEQILTDPS
ncbi:thiosulfate oxidation carrier complex protein SoxZ [Methylotuvimicrobium alcaliphilum]|uniref:Sulfur oxidation protein SoxZ n=1 Tax=Methylotuvimicrobium alcaliphilum (strain DSM 19304 / NCIMB 14124 / VKM B-2133 / 20Z) TaxID=1091494 RepID=G4SW93_META2|nr:thiosulfate oxidation carrier complex protein SoxZ [Methylotuvimicrobium alcaliphilum]CCE23008.1 Sulfur oxidation protein SoxZ [Methylotuvimicrobium alcaliphilum 20Z]